VTIGSERAFERDYLLVNWLNEGAIRESGEIGDGADKFLTPT